MTATVSLKQIQQNLNNQLGASKDLSDLASGSGALSDTPFTPTKSIPPLESWQPKHFGEMDLTIKSNGEWWHEGSKFTRQSLVDLFATVLWREDDAKGAHFYLKTPVEQIRITVEDVPLLAVDVKQIEHDGKVFLEFKTKTGDHVVASQDNPLFMREYDGQLRPYIRVRSFGGKSDAKMSNVEMSNVEMSDGERSSNGALDALIHRNTFYHLFNYGDIQGEAEQVALVLKSGDCVFRLSGFTQE